MSTSITIRPTGTDDTHRIVGSAPGWAYCNGWIASGETTTDGTPITCARCAAMAAPLTADNTKETT